MSITGIQTLYTVVRDMDRMHNFYASALQLEPRFRDGQRWSQFQAGAGGSSAFALSCADEAAPGAAGSIAVFATDDLALAVRTVEQAGGRLLHQRDMGTHGCVATFADPEGNLFQLFSRSAGSVSAA
ncbi:Glyoxalase-like domain protein [compost metagenome]